MSEHEDPKPAPGVYLVKVGDANYGIKKTSKGDPAPTIRFIVKPDNSEASYPVFWQGSFNGGGRDITLEALMRCGLSSPKAIAEMAKGPAARALDPEARVAITVIHEKMTEGPNAGKKVAKVQWINAEGGGGFKDAMDQQGAQAALAALNLEADFFRIAQEKGIKIGPQASRPPTMGTNPPPIDDVPF